MAAKRKTQATAAAAATGAVPVVSKVAMVTKLRMVIVVAIDGNGDETDDGDL